MCLRVGGMAWGISVAAKSGKIAGLQCRVSLIDCLQALFRLAVAAMGVGVVELDQFLVARLEAHQGERGAQVKHVEGGLLSRPRSSPLAAVLRARPFAAAKKAKAVAQFRIVDPPEARADRP